jgi:hypothetical protein
MLVFIESMRWVGGGKTGSRAGTGVTGRAESRQWAQGFRAMKGGGWILLDQGLFVGLRKGVA